MSERWRRSRLRIRQSRLKKEHRKQEFLNRFARRKLPYMLIHVTQNEWDHIQREDPELAKAIDALEITTTTFCCNPVKKAEALSSFVSSINKSPVVWPLRNRLDMPFIRIGSSIPRWECEHNIGDILFSRGFLEYLTTDDIPYYLRNDREVRRISSRIEDIRNELIGVIHRRFD